MRDYVNVTPKSKKEESAVGWGTLFVSAAFVTVCFFVLDAIAADIAMWGL